MNTPDLVTVFNFSQFEPGSDVPVVSPCKAPRDVIEKTLKRNVLEGTGERVPQVGANCPRTDVDRRYRRRMSSSAV